MGDKIRAEERWAGAHMNNLKGGACLEPAKVSDTLLCDANSLIQWQFQFELSLFLRTWSTLPPNAPIIQSSRASPSFLRSGHVACLPNPQSAFLTAVRFLDLVSPFQKWLPEIISPERKVSPNSPPFPKS